MSFKTPLYEQGIRTFPAMFIGTKGRAPQIARPTPKSKIHLAEIDPERTCCGKSTVSEQPGRRISKALLTADLEKVTCKSCIKAYDKLLGITPNLLYPDQDLCYWTKITCEPDCGSILDDFNHPKSGCTVTATANPLVKIYRRGMDDMLVVPLFL